MTSKAGQRIDSALSDDDREALRRRAVRVDEITAAALPTTSELQTGLLFCRDSLQSDVMAYLDSWKAGRDGEIDADLVVATETARANAEPEVLHKVRERAARSFDAHGNYEDALLADRADVWLAYLGDADAQRHVVKQALRVPSGIQKSLVADAYRLAFAVGLPLRRNGAAYDFGDADELMSVGMQRLVRLAPSTPPASSKSCGLFTASCSSKRDFLSTSTRCSTNWTGSARNLLMTAGSKGIVSATALDAASKTSRTPTHSNASTAT
ncbi:hypothetical protein [Devosia nitrariae]|uniref:hypothetical protein n=1 Tax=Devosia nitrariae TaxID=2071872 RepID=UPI0024E1335D|nr:hypothetical protein [Devosia nitrariae]